MQYNIAAGFGLRSAVIIPRHEDLINDIEIPIKLPDEYEYVDNICHTIIKHYNRRLSSNKNRSTTITLFDEESDKK